MLLKHILTEKITGAPWGPKGTIKGGMTSYMKYDKLRARLGALVTQKNKVEQELGIKVGPKEIVLIKRLALIDNMINDVKEVMHSHIDLPLDPGKQEPVDFPFESIETSLNRISKLVTEAEVYCGKLSKT